VIDILVGLDSLEHLQPERNDQFKRVKITKCAKVWQLSIFFWELGVPYPVLFWCGRKGIGFFGLRANKQSTNSSFSTSFNMQLNNESGTISKVRYQRWRLNALAALFETELSTA